MTNLPNLTNPLPSSTKQPPKISAINFSPTTIWLLFKASQALHFVSEKGTTMGGERTKVFTLAEVSHHNNSKDCWLVIRGKVYNVTKFLEDHPGGDEVLLSSTGKDATNDFEDIGHSTSAVAMMDEFYVGDIDSSTIPSKVKYTAPKQPQYNQDKTPEFIIKILQFLVPVLILGLAVGIRFYTKST